MASTFARMREVIRVIKVSTAPMPGDVLQAQERLRPRKEIHGKGFQELLEKEMRRLEERDGKQHGGADRVCMQQPLQVSGGV